jgi:hypothetical protein
MILLALAREEAPCAAWSRASGELEKSHAYALSRIPSHPPHGSARILPDRNYFSATA